ncbi:MAG: hypothetical protein JRH11_11680 [Deltaproteobacteria bacterium]|nr:hypothetical protein [Deltaproteobacteria bacterium]
MDEAAYQNWLEGRAEILRRLPDPSGPLDAATRMALDFTAESLGPVGAYLVDQFASLAELHRAENRALHLGFSTYVFEVFRRELKLEARLPTDDPRYQYYGVPVLHYDGGPDLGPFDLVTFTVHRRDAELLSRVYGQQPRLRAQMSEAEFATWLTFMTDRFDAFLATVHQKTQKKLDFSPESLSAAGELLVSAQPSFASGRVNLNEGDFSVLCGYIGEVFRRHLGQTFFLPPDEGDPAAGQPSMRDAAGSVRFALPPLMIECAKEQEPELVFRAFERMRAG